MKTKLTKEIIEEISKRLKVGCYAKTAAAALNIPRSNYYYWLERGQKARKLQGLGKKVPETEKVYLELLESVRQSGAEGKTALTTAIFSNVTFDMESQGGGWQSILGRIDKPGINY